MQQIKITKMLCIFMHKLIVYAYFISNSTWFEKKVFSLTSQN